MAKAPSKTKEREEIELHPDAWDRFTDFVKRIAKAGPQHRSAKGDVPRKKPNRSRKANKD